MEGFIEIGPVVSPYWRGQTDTQTHRHTDTQTHIDRKTEKRQREREKGRKERRLTKGIDRQSLVCID